MKKNEGPDTSWMNDMGLDFEEKLHLLDLLIETTHDQRKRKELIREKEILCEEYLLFDE